MTLLKQFLELGLDCSPIGLGPGPSQGGYFCTSEGLTVLGWEGVDGIHYGRIRGYGDTVFAINLMSVGEQHACPPAGSLRDFLRLLLACGSITTLERVGDWTREQFNIHLCAPENTVTPDAQAVLECIVSAFRLTSVEDSFSYIKGVQVSLDGGKLHYIDEYYDTLGLARPDRREPAFQGFEFEAVVSALEKE